MKKKISINFIIALIMVAILAVFMGIKYDYYYDLNDDVLMKDILSGAYSGTPQSHNIQMLWPISMIISSLYRLLPSVAWYGLILLLFQYGSLFIIINRTIRFISSDNRYSFILKIVTAASEMLLLGTLMSMHIVNVQYTITVSMMAAAAVMWICDSDAAAKPLQFLINNFPALIIIVLGFLLRSEMMILMFPFICAIGVFKWSFDNKIITKENISKYFSFLIVAIGLMVICLGIDKIAYGTNEWKSFVDLFDARTELYDYQVPFSYEGNEAFYNEIGFSKADAVLFSNYNYGINNTVDNELMWKVADHAKGLRKSSESFNNKLVQKLKIYIYEFTHGSNNPGSDYPWNIVAIALYLLCLVMIITTRDYVGIWRIIALFAGRSAIWMYILLGERAPDRITHSLYFIEIVSLIGLLAMLIKRYVTLSSKQSIMMVIIPAIISIAIVFRIAPEIYEGIRINQDVRNDVNMPYVDLYRYMADNKDDFYFLDTYSTVSYSEKMFGEVSNTSKLNSDTMGGWVTFSPIEKRKFEKNGIKDIYEGLLDENSYFVKDKDIDMEWLSNYYESHGVNIDVTLKTVIEDKYEIYQISCN